MYCRLNISLLLIAYSRFVQNTQQKISDDPSQSWRFVNSKSNTSRIPSALHNTRNEFSKPPTIVDDLPKSSEMVFPDYPTN